MILIKSIFKLILNLCPILLMGVGRSPEHAQSVYSYLSLTEESIKLNNFMLASFIIGVILIYGYYPIRYELLKYKIRKNNSKLKEVTKELRNIFCKDLGTQVKLYDLKLNVRKFKKRQFYRKSFKKWFDRNEIYFEVENYDFLNLGAESDKFHFQVSPIQEGLVGLSYSKQSVMYDDKLTEESRKDKYNINTKQKNNSVIANTDFAIVNPLKVKRNKVKSLISFDTEQDVTIPPDKKGEIEKKILYYSGLFRKLLINID